MADTRRTLTTLTGTTFVDGQSTNAITAQDARDLIVSLAPAYGGCYFSSGSGVTTVAGAGTFVILDTTNVVTTSTQLRNFTSPSNGRLTYTGTPDIMAIIHASLSISATGAGTTIGANFLEGGSISLSSANQKWAVDPAVANRPDTFSLTAMRALSTNDYIECQVTAYDGAMDLTVRDFNMTITGLI